MSKDFDGGAFSAHIEAGSRLPAKTDLTGYAALIGESFQSRVDLLEKILQSRHFPSLGAYKERLLLETVRNFLPKSLEVGTGFVLFPHEDTNPPAEGKFYDDLNQSAYAVLRQCDILVYDAARYPPIFKDSEFVILRPEAVHAVVEVKGKLSSKELSKTLTAFLDFGQKWQDTQRFYAKHYQVLSRSPQLHCFCWNAVATTEKAADRFRTQVADFYRNNVPLSRFGKFPFLDSLMIYNEWEMSETQGIEGHGSRKYQVGWYSRRGRFVRINDNGSLYLDKDRTISSLLAKLHYSAGSENFNRFFSYLDEVKIGDHQLHVPKFSWAWETDEIEPIKRRNKDELPPA